MILAELIQETSPAVLDGRQVDLYFVNLLNTPREVRHPRRRGRAPRFLRRYGEIYTRPTPPTRGFPELFAPIRAVLNTRTERGDESLYRLFRLYDGRRLGSTASAPVTIGEPINFVIATGGEVKVHLGWHMSELARCAMRKQLNPSTGCGERGSGKPYSGYSNSNKLDRIDTILARRR